MNIYQFGNGSVPTNLVTTHAYFLFHPLFEIGIYNRKVDSYMRYPFNSLFCGVCSVTVNLTGSKKRIFISGDFNIYLYMSLFLVSGIYRGRIKHKKRGCHLRGSGVNVDYWEGSICLPFFYISIQKIEWE